MSNNYFKFKQFTVHQEHAPFKITTDSVMLGAWAQLKGAKNVLDIGTGTGYSPSWLHNVLRHR